MQPSVIDPLQEFHDAIQNPITRKNYENRLAQFLVRVCMEGNTLQEKASGFVSQAKKDDGEWATFQINQYMSYQKARAERGEISESTLPNFFKPIKLFLHRKQPCAEMEEDSSQNSTRKKIFH